MSEEVQEKPRLRQICSTIAQERGLDPIGGAYPYDHFLIMEGALPWPLEKFQEPGVLPQAIIDLQKQVFYVNYPTDWVRVCQCIVAPDKGYSVPGMRRMIYAKRPTEAFAEFEKVEYLLPEEMMGPLAWALFKRPEELPNFEQWRQPTEGVRDFLVCTDGLVDRACAVVGMKLYSTLRKLPEAQPGGNVRVWKTSHFGGHVYAATLLTLPDGRMWGFLDGESGPSLARRQGDIQALRGCYRGWIGATSPFLSVVERELMMMHGWSWFDYLQTGKIVTEDPEPPIDHYNNPKPRWSEVEITYYTPTGELQGSATARVEISHEVETFYASDNPELYAYPQYRMQDFDIQETQIAKAR